MDTLKNLGIASKIKADVRCKEREGKRRKLRGEWGEYRENKENGERFSILMTLTPFSSNQLGSLALSL